MCPAAVDSYKRKEAEIEEKLVENGKLAAVLLSTQAGLMVNNFWIGLCNILLCTSQPPTNIS